MSRGLNWTGEAWDDYLYWQGQDKKTLKKINALIKSARRLPEEGPGKPEPLKGTLSGFWSRRIDGKNRLIYRADRNILYIISCRFHYDDK
jgi:toxin YoeB